MSNHMNVLTQRLFGYNIKQVDEYLDEINITHQKTVNFLKDSISNYRQEKKRLQSELAALKDVSQGERNSQELLAAAMKKSAKTILLINKFADEEVNKIMEEVKNKMPLHEKKLHEMEQNMEARRAEINTLLNKVLMVCQEYEATTIQANDQLSENNIDKDNHAPEQSKSMNSPFERILNHYDWQKTLRQFHRAARMGKNTFGKQDDIIVSPKKMTADGSTLSDINKVHEISQQVGQPNQDGKKVITNETFWEDLEDINSDSQGIISRVNNVVNLNVISKQLSPSVPQEIEKIREKYVVGKIAGSDLYDAEGNLIISKNSVITADIVKKAEQESKLAELIVNMSLPVIKD